MRMTGLAYKNFKSSLRSYLALIFSQAFTIMIFYHFQNMRYLSENRINVSSGTHSKKVKDAIYPVYLREIEQIRKELGGLGVSFSVKKIYSSNKLIAFLQGNILRFKVKSLSDIYQLEQFR